MKARQNSQTSMDELADRLFHTDYSSESRIREELRRRLAERSDHSLPGPRQVIDHLAASAHRLAWQTAPLLVVLVLGWAFLGVSGQMGVPRTPQVTVMLPSGQTTTGSSYTAQFTPQRTPSPSDLHQAPGLGDDPPAPVAIPLAESYLSHISHP